MARTDLAAGVSRYLLCDAALVFHERIDGVLECRRLRLRGIECDLCILLLAELVGARRDNPVVSSDRAQLLIEGSQLLLLCVVGDRSSGLS